MGATRKEDRRLFLDSRPVTRALATVMGLGVAALALVLTLALVRVMQSNQATTGVYAASNRDLVAKGQEENQQLIQALANTQREVVEQQKQLVEQQRQQVALTAALVALQERVTGFSDQQIRGRRAQGVREGYRVELCRAGRLQGKDCEGLSTPAQLEMLDR